MDASIGYKKAHNWTRPTSKAPPLPTHMWRKSKYYRHPHEIRNILLQEWGSIWTQKSGRNLATKMGGRLQQLIRTSREHDKNMEQITVEDVIRGIKLMNSGTAVGIDHLSPHHWTQLSPEALEAIAHLFNHIEKHGV